MASWTQLRDALRSAFVVEIDEPNGLGLRFDVGEGRTQSVSVTRLIFEGEEWVEIATGIGVEGEIDPRDALRLSGSMVIGGLALQDNLIVFRHTLPLKNLDSDEFHTPFSHVVKFGDELERRVGASSEDRF